jgi:RNA polymerase sigma-70 factor, ECF subfamily
MADAIERLYEQVLVLRCQAGDHAAFAELVEQYSPRLRYFLRKMLGVDRAEDALQNVWLDVFCGMKRLSTPAAFTTWVYRIAHNRAHYELRLEYRAVHTSLEEEHTEMNADEEVFSAADAERIHKGLASLPATQREVLTLRYLEGMSYEQICQVISCPVGTVRSRIYYAKQALRAQWEGKGEP